MAEEKRASAAFEKILVCSDGSDRSIKAVEHAASLAAQYGAQLTLLHVCQVPPLQQPFPGAPTLAGPALDRYVSAMHAAVAARTVPVLEASGVGFEVLEETGNPADVIARVANQQGYDLVVLGSRGVSVQRATELGSVCHNVIHNASCPVLVVR